MPRSLPIAIALSAAAFVACGGGNSALNQTSITCPTGRTLLDGVCVSEGVADYVACVRAQGAQLGGEKSQSISAEAGTIGVHAAAAADVKESLAKKYAVSDQATLEIIHACARTAGPAPATAAAPAPEPPIARSEDTKQPAKVTFTNGRSSAIQIFWKDFAGQEIAYQTLTPGQSLDYNSFLRHVFVFREVGSGRIVGSFTVTVPDPPQTFVVR